MLSISKGPITWPDKIRENQPPTKENSSLGLGAIIIGADESTWGPFWRAMSLVKYYEKVHLVGHEYVGHHSTM